MGFPDDVRRKALVGCGRCCALCHRFCGLKIEIHHIVPRGDGGDDSFDNCIPLCFDCHADMRSYDHRHPKGTKYTAEELKAHRDRWFTKVEKSVGVGVLPEHLDLDRATFLRLLEILPWNGTILFIRHNNFAGFSFSRDSIDDLYRFLHECQDPTLEFLDADLESLRIEILNPAREFSKLIGYETFPTGTPRHNTVPPEWEIEQPERFARVVDALHAATEQICGAYDRLVALGRRKLGVQAARPSKQGVSETS